MADPQTAQINGSRLATTFALRPQQFAWLLGAGASASAGIPTGYMMIRDFKTHLFCQETRLPRREVDATDPLWVERVEAFFRQRSLLPPAGDPSEYAAAFEAVYPTEEERQLYIEDAIRKGTPSFAHRVFASLISTKRVPCVFTTNFDPLVEIATTHTDQLLDASERAHLTVAALDSVERASRCLRQSSWPLVAKIHGDYKSVRLKNTTDELQRQDAYMRAVLVGACQRFGLIVVGYSGRDESVMQALEDVLQTSAAYPAGIYWVGHSEKDLLPAVRRLFAKATAAGVAVAFVQSQGFDELAADLLNPITLPDVLHKHVFERRPQERLRSVRLPTVVARKFPILRCSAFPISQMPTIARRLTLSKPVSTVKVRQLLKEAKVRAVMASTGRAVAAFGPDEQLVAALSSLGARVDGTMSLKPDAESWALGLLYDALTTALCRHRPLYVRMRRSGHSLLVALGKPGESEERKRTRAQRLAKLQRAYKSPLGGTMPNLGFPFAEGVRLTLEYCADRWWCVFDPFTFIEFPQPQDAQPEVDGETEEVSPVSFRRGDPAGDWRRERWATRYNPIWTNIIDAWADLLCSSDEGTICAFGLDADSGIDALFGVSSVTAWSRPGQHHAYFDRQR